MAGYGRLELGAVVALDHNYSQICPIRVMKVQKDPHATLLSAINVQPKKTKNKSFISTILTDQGETLEEDDLVEYYTQWCDRAFSSDNLDKVKFPLEAESVRSRASTSFSFEYDSFESNNGDSGNSYRSVSVPPSESMNNLNLLANCGVEQNSRESSSTNESNPSASPHSSKDSADFDDSKTESDYQVLAAANALLQLSGNEKSTMYHNGSPDSRKRKFSNSDQQVKEESWPLDHQYGHNYTSMYDQPGTSAFYPFKSFRSKTNKLTFTARANQVKKNYLYGFQRADKGSQRKKKKRKYKKAVGKRQALFEDDDSLDGDVTYPNITYAPCSQYAASRDPWGQALPTNVLLNIFQHAVQSDGSFPFLCRASKVCKLWYTTAAHSSLWEDVDLSGERIRKLKKCFLWLCKNRLPPTRVLNLTNWEIITGKEIQVLSKYCNNIQSISLSRCTKLNSSALRGLIENCADLDEIDLSYTSTVITSRYMLEYLLEARGSQLRSLNLATNILVKFDIVMQSIMDKCCMLEVLDLSNVVFSNCLMPIHIEQVQIGCPRLRVVLFTNSLFKVKRASVDEEAASISGFANLETLSVARSSATRIAKYRYINDEVLYRFLKSSPKLTSLDISGCRHVTNAGLMNLPVPNLVSLNISHCPLVNQSSIHCTLEKWSHSLQDLDLGGNSIEADFLSALLDNCPHLDNLSLTGCKGLPWHVRRQYQRDTLQDLRDSLENWNEDNG